MYLIKVLSYHQKQMQATTVISLYGIRQVESKYQRKFDMISEFLLYCDIDMLFEKNFSASSQNHFTAM